MSAVTEMRSIRFSLAIALAVAATPVCAAVGDFRLPPAPGTQQPPPDRQGPVAPDVPESRRPAPTPTPAPAPTAAAPVPTPAPSPTITPPSVTLPPPAASSRPNAAPARTASPMPTRPAISTAPPVDTATPLPSSPAVTGAAPPLATTPAPTANEPESGESLNWLWIAIGIAAAAGLGLGAFLLRRHGTAGAVAVPEIERPKVAPEPISPAPAPEPALARVERRPAPTSAAAAEPLQVSLEPLRLSLTLMNAALAYRLEIANRGATALTGLAIGADMISAHASMSREEQLSGPANGAGAMQKIERLEPGESRVVEGEFRLPFGQIVPIRQGKAALLLPLARFRVVADGAQPVVRTFVVGQPGNGSSLQPFRLDQGPRIYPKLAQHAFA